MVHRVMLFIPRLKIGWNPVLISKILYIVYRKSISDFMIYFYFLLALRIYIIYAYMSMCLPGILKQQLNTCFEYFNGNEE